MGNVKIFKVQGQALDQFAKKSVKVLVVGNPANTNALICSHYAPSIPKENFSAMTRLDQNRAAGQLALKLGKPVNSIKKVTIWGNHSSTQFPDASQATADGHALGLETSWLESEFMPTVQKRGAAVIAARKLSSAMSAAKAASDHMKSWFSFPITIENGKWSIVQGLVMSDFAKEKLAVTGKELCEEREEAMAVCNAWV